MRRRCVSCICVAWCPVCVNRVPCLSAPALHAACSVWELAEGCTDIVASTSLGFAESSVAKLNTYVGRKVLSGLLWRGFKPNTSRYGCSTNKYPALTDVAIFWNVPGSCCSDLTPFQPLSDVSPSDWGLHMALGFVLAFAVVTGPWACNSNNNTWRTPRAVHVARLAAQPWVRPRVHMRARLAGAIGIRLR